MGSDKKGCFKDIDRQEKKFRVWKKGKGGKFLEVKILGQVYYMKNIIFKDLFYHKNRIIFLLRFIYLPYPTNLCGPIEKKSTPSNHKFNKKIFFA